MKKIYSLIIVAIVLVACCGEKEQSVEELVASDNLKPFRTKKDELVNEQQALADSNKTIR